MCNDTFDSAAQIGNKCYGGFVSRIYLCLPMYMYAYIHTDTHTHIRVCVRVDVCVYIYLYIFRKRFWIFGLEVGWKGG